MLSKKELSVIDWLIVWFLLVIPMVNFVFVLYALLSPKVNKTFQNMIKAYILMIIIVIILYFVMFASMM